MRSPRPPTAATRLGILTTAGVEVLIHVGVDTVEMKGDGFSPKVKEGDKVKKGDLLLEMDLDKIAAAAHPAVVITVITNTDDFKDVEVVASGRRGAGRGSDQISKVKFLPNKKAGHPIGCPAFWLPPEGEAVTVR